MSGFLTSLDCRETDEFGGLWTLLAPLAYDSDLLGKIVTVPAGFVTDFASIPRLPFVYLAEGGKGNKAAVIHDWLYSAQSVDRKTADQILREALIASGYSKATAAVFYAAVRLGGGSHWTEPNNPQTPWVQQIMERPLPKVRYARSQILRELLFLRCLADDDGELIGRRRHLVIEPKLFLWRFITNLRCSLHSSTVAGKTVGAHLICGECGSRLLCREGKRIGIRHLSSHDPRRRKFG